MSTAAVTAERLYVEVDGREIAQLESLAVDRGEVVALLGPNGSGKSTLLRSLALVEAPTSGEVRILGSLADAGSTPRLRRHVTLALPQPRLFRASVQANVERGLAVRGVARADRARRALAALEQVGLRSLAERSAPRLSSGEKARVALARALVLETKVLLLDEPFAHMDPDAVPAAAAAVRRRVEAGTAVVAAALDTAELGGLDARVVRVLAPRAPGRAVDSARAAAEAG